MPLYHLLREITNEPFLVSATRLGGTHGYGPQAVTEPIGGAISGFTKAISIERPEQFAKVVDFTADETPTQIAARLIEETLRDPGVVEVGWEGSQRYSVGLVERAVDSEAFDLGKKPVFLVSGGSGGITAPVVIDLAQHTKGTFYLLGRTPLPQEVDEDIQRVRNDREGLKKDLLTRIEKATPAKVEQQLARLEKAAAAIEAVNEVRTAGGDAVYLTCDVTDDQAVQSVVADILKKHKRVDVVIHAAGVERSRKLTLKPEEEFRSTLAAKATGFFNLYHALKQKKALPKAAILFGSVAGRFGNSGQTDYSAANDLLCKLTATLREMHPQMKAVAIDWSAWSEVGMASRGYIPQLMEMGGIDMMAP
jgi:NAD(P)-dependent dehydrogenase (short-subunit alcohol dehydrogenase family)